MIKKTLFITRVYHLKLIGDFGKGIEIFNNTYLTNNQSYITQLFSKFSAAAEVIGKIEMDELYANGPVIYSVSEEEQEEIEDKLIFFLYIVQLFSTLVWLEFDSCIETEMAYAVYNTSDNCIVSSNCLKYSFTKSTGNIDTFESNKSTINKIINSNELSAEKIDQQINSKTLLDKDLSRINRAMYFFTMARGTHYVEFKIANYCSGFEALLSTSQSELSHQLAERMSIILYQQSEDRIDCYSNIKKIYNIRSKVVHGDTLSNSNTVSIFEYVVKCDQYARSIVKKITTNDKMYKIFTISDQKEIDSFFLSCLLNNNQEN